MDADLKPVVVAFDGSDESREAVVAAAGLFPGRRLVVVSVFEPGLPLMTETYADPLGTAYALPSAEDIATVDRIQHEHADAVAEAGAKVAREHGADAEPVAVRESADIADTLASEAEARDAAAIVVGSRGRGRVKSAVLGSTSKRLLHDSRRPVLVVRAP